MTTRRRRARPGRLLLGLLALLVAAVWAFPVYWMAISSLMSNIRLQSGAPTFWPVNASLDNYAAVWPPARSCLRCGCRSWSRA